MLTVDTIHHECDPSTLFVICRGACGISPMCLGCGDDEDEIGVYAERVAQELIYLRSTSTDDVRVWRFLDEGILPLHRVLRQKDVVHCATISDIIRA